MKNFLYIPRDQLKIPETEEEAEKKKVKKKRTFRGFFSRSSRGKSLDSSDK